MAHTITETQTLITETCCSCGIMFAMPENFKNQRCSDKSLFYCPNGHGQHYTGETSEAKIKRLENQLRIEKEYKEDYRMQRDRIQNELNRHQTRTKNGVCPCCKRSFQNLRRHIESKHPDYGKKRTNNISRHS